MMDIGRRSEQRPRSAGEFVADRLRSRLVRGELKPGDKLPSEADLMTHYNVSRPTLREAIRILEFEALVVVSRGVGGGVRVRTPSYGALTHAIALALGLRGATLQDVFQTRIIIEPQAARFAAENSAASCAEALRRLHETESAVSAEDFSVYNAAVIDFHRGLLEYCGNPGLSVLGQAMQDVISEHLANAIRQQYPPADRRAKLRKAGLKSQQRLIDLIAAGDGDGAQIHWTRHLEAISPFWLVGVRDARVNDLFD